MKLRTRMAPSPTGFLHIGNLRTALYDYALAKRNGGDFVLRIEDTDRERYIPEALDYLLHIFDDFGLTPDESPKVGGPFAPYVQSERLDIYTKYAEQLIEEGFAYRCYLTSEEADKLKDECRLLNKPLRSPYRDSAEAKDGVFTIRFKVEEGKRIDFEDGVQGKISISSSEVEDWVMIKSDGYPTYNFAVVIDDHLMEISHVLRGIEFITSTPKNLMLYEAFGWSPPRWFHLPVLMEPTGGKLSKRKGAVNAGEFLEEGYLPEAILNFLMFLGWSAPEARAHGERERELYTLEEFVAIFDEKDLNKSNPAFNREKLIWFNQKYLQGMSVDDLAARFLKWADDFSVTLTEGVREDSNLGLKLALVKERVRLLSEIDDAIAFFYIQPKNIDWKIPQLANAIAHREGLLAKFIEFYESADQDSSLWEHTSWEENVRKFADEAGLKHGEVFMLLRVAVCGSPYSPPLFESLQLLGRDEVLQRLREAM